MSRNLLKGVVFTGLFVIPFIPFLVFSSFFFPFITSKAFSWRIIVEIVFAAWILLALLDAEYRPKRSLILYAILGFLAVIGLADILGVEPIKSFWSNFERMEGYITILHLGMFFIVITSVFKEIDWKRWWNVSLVASFLMVLYSVLQIIGLKTINQGGVRVDGTLGNAIYLAVYMLFHIFIALLFMWREWKNLALRWVYGLLILLQMFVLYYTATRGAILGLLGGLVVIALLNIRNKENTFVRKASTGVLTGLVILVGGFMLIKDAKFVQNSPVLSRFSSLSVEEIKTQGRYFVWPIALQGVKERPFFGWGQENFNYIFNEHYRPEMYRLEPWFDRAHNTFLDWAVSGGLLGLVSYLVLYFALLFSIWNRGANLPYAEKTILTGLVVAYFFHNFFVFDHLISYILFFSLLAYLHYRNGGKILLSGGLVTEFRMNAFALPAISILLVLVLYYVNVKPIIANTSLIQALVAIRVPENIKVKSPDYFKKAYRVSRLGRPEAVEQIAANSVAILSSNISKEEKDAFFAFAADAVMKQAEESKDDARYELVAGSFFLSLGLFDDALKRFERAKELMPGKQTIYLELAQTYANKGETDKAIETLRYVGEISPDHRAEMDGYIKQLENRGAK